MTRLARLANRLCPALACAAGIAALGAGSASAQSAQVSCMNQVSALRAAAGDAPQAVSDWSAFHTALSHAEGWRRRGDRASCAGWVRHAETLFAAPAGQGDEAAPARIVTGTERGQVQDDNRNGWIDAWVAGDGDGRSGGARAGGGAGFEPRPYASADAVRITAIPVRRAMSDLERSARRQLLGGPETTPAEIPSHVGAGPATLTRYQQTSNAAPRHHPAGDAIQAMAMVQAVRFENNESAMSWTARQAVHDAVTARGGAGVITVRGDSSDARFADRADRLVRALGEQGVSRRDIEVIWGRVYGDDSQSFELAVTPAPARAY